MKKVEKKLSAELRKQILYELSIPGCVVSKIATTYGISRSTLYNWKEKQALEEQEEKKPIEEQKILSSKFIELSLQEEVERAKLTKAKLVFDSFSLLIEGDFNSNKLLKIINALGEG